MRMPPTTHDAVNHLLLRLMDPADHLQVLWLHGSPGVGKTTVARNAAALARRRGLHVAWLTGRTGMEPGAAGPDTVDRLRRDAPELVVVDAIDDEPQLERWLLGEVVGRLPQRTRYVVTARRQPTDGWEAPGWSWRSHAQEILPLDDAAALEYLAQRQIPDARTPELVAWAGGNPLALGLAATHAHEAPCWSPSADPTPTTLAAALVGAVIGEIAASRYPDVLALAAQARTVTRDLITACLPETDAGLAWRWLREQSFVEPRGQGVALPELVRLALRTVLATSAPEVQREVRRKVADHYHARGMEGRPRMTAELADLLERHDLRAAFRWPSDRLRVDVVRPGDIDAIEAHMSSRGHTEWWQAARRWFDDGSDCVRIARDEHGSLCGYAIVVSSATAPACAYDDPVVGPWLADAAGRTGDAVFWRDSVDVRGVDGAGSCVGFLNVAGVVAAGVANPRWAYMGETAGQQVARLAAEMLDARRVPRLDVIAGGVAVGCWIVDLGAGGLLGAQRDVVYRELGLVPPVARVRTCGPPITAEVVRDALRTYRDPIALSSSPLATGATTDVRAAAVRELLQRGLAEAFYGDDRGILMRRVLELAYITPELTRDQAAAELGISRSTLFRVAGEATVRLADFLDRERVAMSAPA